MPKILFDHQCFTYQDFGGVSRLFAELISNLKKQNEIEPVLSVKFSNNIYLKELLPFIQPDKMQTNANWLYNGAFPLKGRLFKLASMINLTTSRNKYEILNQQETLKLIREGNFDFFHPTYYDDYFLEELEKQNKKFIITIYDMIHERFASHFKKIDVVMKNKKNLCEKATKIYAISENTKKDICELYNIPEEKIQVIHLSHSLGGVSNSSESNRLSFLKDKKYILYVGNRSGYKNFNKFIVSLSDWLNTNPEIKVVCAGSESFSVPEFYLLHKLKIKNQVLHISIKNDSDLNSLYTNALSFIYPSLYEGFGIPILEAFYSGCPVICSDASSFPEVAEDAAFYFDPNKEISILNAVKEVTSNESLRLALSEKGFQIVKKYSWEKNAEEYTRMIKSIL